MFLDFGSMVVYVFVAIAVFFMIGVVALFAVLHLVVQARAKKARDRELPHAVPLATFASSSRQLIRRS